MVRNRISKLPRYRGQTTTSITATQSKDRLIPPQTEFPESNIRIPSLKLAGDDNDNDAVQLPMIRDTGAERVVLNPGRYISGIEPEPVHWWGPIHSSTVAAQHWNQHLDAVTSYLTRKGIPWAAVHLGTLNDEVTVAVLYNAGGVWDENLLKQELRSLYFPAEIFAEIIFALAEVKKEEAAGLSEYTDSVRCGAGIGIRGVNWSSGTVGGYFQSDDGSLYGLTCHHVLLPTKQRSYSDDNKAKIRGYPAYLDRVGVDHSEFDSQNGGIEVVHPPCGMHERAVSGFLNAKKDKQREIENLNTVYESRGTRAPRNIIKKIRGAIAEISNGLSIVQKYNRSFGTVVATSGYRVEPGTRHSIDWGLFKIPERRIARWKKPRTVWNETILDERCRPSASWSRLLLSNRTCFRGIADPVEDEKVFKVGRSTGQTFGIISGVKDGVTLRENLGQTMEWCVVGTHEDRGKDFAAAGDSGSLVFNQNLEVVGIITAGCSFTGRLTYITPIKLVLADIERKTGMRLHFSDGTS
ncbi:hypothetical protein TWF281_006217 [Arthrobotrys megalospora]